MFSATFSRGTLKERRPIFLKLFLGSLKIPTPVGISCGEPEESEVTRSMREPILSAFWKRVRIVDLQNTENMVYSILEDVAAALGTYLLDKWLTSLSLQVPTSPSIKGEKTLACNVLHVVGIFLSLGFRALTCEEKRLPANRIERNESGVRKPLARNFWGTPPNLGS